MSGPDKRAAYRPENLNSDRRLEPAGKVRLMLTIVDEHGERPDLEAVVDPAVEAGPDLDELCRLAARQMIVTALEADRRTWLDAHAEVTDVSGKRLVVGNGHQS